MFNEIKIEIKPNLFLAAKTWGNPQSPPLIAVHGWLDNADSFTPMANYLQNKFYVIAIDLIGHGHSDHLPQAAMYHYIESVEHILTVADKLGFTKFSLMGHSMGAGLAPLIAACIPGKIQTLFLLDSIGPLVDRPENAVLRLVKYLKYIQRQRKNKNYTHIEDAIKTRMENSAMSHNSAKLIVERGIIYKDNLYFWRHDPRLLYPSATRFTEEQIEVFLQAINCPTVVIWPEDGYHRQANFMKHRQEKIKNLSTFSIPGGHHAHMDYPKETAEIILN